jgi:hypothetical protein
LEGTVKPGKTARKYFDQKRNRTLRQAGISPTPKNSKLSSSKTG